MRVVTERSEVGSALREMAEELSSRGGSIAPDFTVHERDGHLSVAVGSREPKRIVVSYPSALRPPMGGLKWRAEPERLCVADGMAQLASPHRVIVQAWLTLINSIGRPKHVRESVPRYAVASWSLRHHLAQGGYPDLRQPPCLASVQQTVIAWHSAGAINPPRSPGDVLAKGHPSGEPDVGGVDGARPDLRDWFLIPLKCFVNHHPDGANQNPIPGKIAVSTATPTDTAEIFEDYGDLDAMQLLMNFGYLDSAAPLVHSVPVEVESAHLGRVVVRWRAPRNPRGGAAARDAPTLRPTEEGLELRHLTARPENRARVAAFLAMAGQARAGLSPSDARVEAEALIDTIAQANLTYYRSLDELVVEAIANPAPPIVEGFGTSEILPTIAAMSMLQQQRLKTFWG